VDLRGLGERGPEFRGEPMGVREGGGRMGGCGTFFGGVDECPNFAGVFAGVEAGVEK